MENDRDAPVRISEALEQLRLFPVENPLKSRFGKEFFKSIPNCPGVYFMRGRHQEVLYVGKAKSLRARLCSYRSKALCRKSPKTWRLLNQVETIEWKIHISEEEALLEENRLLRELKPKFNIVNTLPETYFYIGLHTSRDRTSFKISRETTDFSEDFRLFGAFKGNATVPRSFVALARQFWCLTKKNIDWPLEFIRPKPLKCITFEHDTPLETPAREFQELVGLFLSGSNRSLLDVIAATHNEIGDIPSLFARNWLEADWNLLERFFYSGPAKIRTLKDTFQLTQRIISKDTLDDYLTLFRQARTTEKRESFKSAALQEP